jgi:hypothetical protein
LSAAIVSQTPREFFHEAVTGALAHRRLRVQDETEFYLVELLATFLAAPRGQGDPTAEPLALMLGRALAAPRPQRYRALKQLGDTSLFVSGFFPDSLARSPVGPSYYAAMGERAYGSLAEGLGPAGLEPLYDELARRFADFADLYAEIAEMAELRSCRGLVRLYQRFLDTGSRRVAEKLRERGVALFAPPPHSGLRH